MALVSVVVVDSEDDIWWEMPDDMVDRLMRAETTGEYAAIARDLGEHVAHAEESVAKNRSDRASATDSE